ncbi:hypothetical protein BFG51_04580 [Dietzia alimentaria]|nr:hypothetical protein BFG51_04580 [Dietzia alimentaria]
MLLQEIRDHSLADILVPAETTSALSDFFSLNLNSEETLVQVRYWREFGEVLTGVTRHARMLLAIAIKYANRDSRCWGLTVSELSRRTREGSEKLNELGLELEQSGIAYTDYDPEWYEHTAPMFVIGSKFDEQLETLASYATGMNIELADIIANLRFELLDSTSDK